MGKQIIKATPGRDLYIEWSSVVEAPTFIGTRAEVAAYLMRAFRGAEADRLDFEAGQVEKRLARADQDGSSGLPPFDCNWDSNGEIYMQQGWLRRDKMEALAEAYLANPHEPAVDALLEPFEDDEPAPVGSLEPDQPA